MKITSDTDQDDIIIPLDLAGCMVHFKHRLPTKGEITSLQQYCLTQGDRPWNPSSFSDQVADVFYKQVIDTGRGLTMQIVQICFLMTHLIPTKIA